MAMKDGFDPDTPLPLFLSADETDQGIGNDEAIISLRGLVASILVAAAIATGTALLSNRVTLFADVTASPVDKSAPQPDTNQSTPIIQSAVIQSTADAEALAPTAKDAPSREISATEPVSQTRTENGEASLGEASYEALFREFQAWAAEQDARALAKPAQDAPSPVVENALAPLQPQQKQRRARSVHNTRAEIRRAQERRAYVRQQNERVQARSVQDARAQAQPIQNEPPSFLDSLNPFAASPPQR